jgi:hypothetical protein
MRTERPHLNRKIHGDSRGVPTRSGKAFEDRFFCCLFIEMKRLRIELGREAQDIFPGDRRFTALETHPQLQVVEPFDHRILKLKGALQDTGPSLPHPRFNSLKKSLPLSSMMMKAGKSITSMRQIASMPSSGYSTTSTFLMQCSARFAAAPPIEPR